jgi:Tfp pilus assembly protein FimT
MKKSLSGREGFSFIEIIICVAMIFIIGNGVFVTTRSLERYRLIKTAKILQEDLRYIQTSAIQERRKYVLSIDSNTNTYHIYRVNNYGVLVKLEDTHIANKIMITTNAKNNSISYTSEGTTGSACTINIKTKNYTIDMTINVGSGRIKTNKIQKNK